MVLRVSLALPEPREQQHQQKQQRVNAAAVAGNAALRKEDAFLYFSHEENKMGYLTDSAPPSDGLVPAKAQEQAQERPIKRKARISFEVHSNILVDNDFLQEMLDLEEEFNSANLMSEEEEDEEDDPIMILYERRIASQERKEDSSEENSKSSESCDSNNSSNGSLWDSSSSSASSKESENEIKMDAYEERKEGRKRAVRRRARGESGRLYK